MQYDRMLTKNYAIEICNFLNEEDSETIDFNLQFKRKGDHKGIAISLFIARRQFEFNIYNIHHEKHCFGCGVELTEKNFLTDVYDLTGVEICKRCDHGEYNIDAVHPVLKRVIKFDCNHDEAIKFYKELQNAGYEKKDIILTR
jgi:hypothetical protein